MSQLPTDRARLSELNNEKCPRHSRTRFSTLGRDTPVARLSHRVLARLNISNVNTISKIDFALGGNKKKNAAAGALPPPQFDRLSRSIKFPARETIIDRRPVTLVPATRRDNLRRKVPINGAFA